MRAMNMPLRVISAASIMPGTPTRRAGGLGDQVQRREADQQKTQSRPDAVGEEGFRAECRGKRDRRETARAQAPT